jgi:hypothetical protein
MFFVDPCGTGKGKADADTLFQNIYELCGNNWMIVTTERCGTASGGPSQRHFVSLPIVYPINIFYSDRGAAHVPSLMRSLELIEAQDPDTIVLCTSGPIGLMGLIVAGLHHIRLVRASAGAEEATRNKDPIIHFAAACIRSLSARTSELQGSANGSTGPNEEQTERIVAAARYARYLVYSLFSNPEASPEPLRSVA